ncbi:RagB/SusD family protein [Tenacibaculum soleae]|uniref:RagB/SusD family protein n=1 Tax=Tenacibaculum soleae TaxID=447689 RepID=A0A1B9Y1G0_9FLAO|nr:RagB/SusD family nutrient uptake outer membrane protein [Tenacibaculum soleae]OCK43620.1 RagB/SusD family protein [Tenacibaculum soleae]
MKNNINKLFVLFLVSLFVVSCNEFLDELPDNRTEVDNNDKIRKILVSAYPTTAINFLAELSSDNIDDTGVNNPYSDRITEQVAYWKDVTETDNDGPASLWSACYNAIANANQALAGIKDQGNPESLSAEKGEALITRAYGHFVLVNMFSKHYNTQTSDTDLGIPFLENPETTLNPKYDRGNVKDVYAKINKDIEEALPLIRDDIYNVPKYHFNVKASYAFAARFNLYYENWEKAKEYASIVVTQNPTSILRNWQAQAQVVRSPAPATKAFYENTSVLLTQAVSSGIGVHFGAYYTGSRFNHTGAVARRESLSVPLPWTAGTNPAFYPHYRPFVYSGTNLDKTLFMKLPYLFEYTDPVALTGYSKSIIAPFTTDETLLVRAEANVMLKQYDAALDDLNTFTKNYNRPSSAVPSPETSIAQVNTFYDAVTYSTEDVPTQKKTLTPMFTVESGTQENMLHYTLQLRRILTMHEGLRWFDNKRYGMSVVRYQNGTAGSISVVDVLTANDARKAIQLPQDVISAGLTPNPR